MKEFDRWFMSYHEIWLGTKEQTEEAYIAGYKAGHKAGTAKQEADNAKLREKYNQAYDEACKWYNKLVALKQQIDKCQIERNRLFVLATKWCDKTHQDWSEIGEYRIDLFDVGDE